MCSGRGSRASVSSALVCTLPALHSLLSEVWGRGGCFPSIAPLLRCASHRPEVQSLLGTLNLCSSPRPRRSPQGPHMPQQLSPSCNFYPPGWSWQPLPCCALPGDFTLGPTETGGKGTTQGILGDWQRKCNERTFFWPQVEIRVSW